MRYLRAANRLKRAIVGESEEGFKDALRTYADALMGSEGLGYLVDFPEFLETAYSHDKGRFAFMVAYLSHMGGKIQEILPEMLSSFILFKNRSQPREIEELDKIIKIIFYNLRTSQCIDQNLRSPEYINSSLRNRVLTELYHAVNEVILEGVHATLDEGTPYIEYLLKLYGIMAAISKNNRAEVDGLPAVLKQAFLNAFALSLILDPSLIKINELRQALIDNGDNNVTISSILEGAYQVLTKLDPDYELIGNQSKPVDVAVFEAKFELFKLAKQHVDVDFMYKILNENSDLMAKLSTRELKEIKNDHGANHGGLRNLLQNRIQERKNIAQNVLTNYINPVVNPREHEAENPTEDKLDSLGEVAFKLANYVGSFFHNSEPRPEPEYEIDLAYLEPIERDYKLIRKGTGIDIDDSKVYDENETELSSQIAGLITRYVI